MNIKQLSSDGKTAYLIKPILESIAGSRRAVRAF